MTHRAATVFLPLGLGVWLATAGVAAAANVNLTLRFRDSGGTTLAVRVGVFVGPLRQLPGNLDGSIFQERGLVQLLLLGRQHHHQCADGAGHHSRGTRLRVRGARHHDHGDVGAHGDVPAGAPLRHEEPGLVFGRHPRPHLAPARHLQPRCERPSVDRARRRVEFHQLDGRGELLHRRDRSRESPRPHRLLQQGAAQRAFLAPHHLGIEAMALRRGLRGRRRRVRENARRAGLRPSPRAAGPSRGDRGAPVLHLRPLRHRRLAGCGNVARHVDRPCGGRRRRDRPVGFLERRAADGRRAVFPGAERGLSYTAVGGNRLHARVGRFRPCGRVSHLRAAQRRLHHGQLDRGLEGGAFVREQLSVVHALRRRRRRIRRRPLTQPNDVARDGVGSVSAADFPASRFGATRVFSTF